MKTKSIGYTTRFNAFWNDANRPDGVDSFDSDGEGIYIDNYLKGLGTSIKQVVDFTNIMMYDVPPSQLGAPGGFQLE